jgi:hypothetical protein
LVRPTLLYFFGVADEASDSLAIDRVIATLNEPSQRDAAFAANGNGRAEFERLRRLNPRAFRIVPPSVDAAAPVDHPTVTISHEPWGEAAITLPGLSGVMRGGIVFIASDISLADISLAEGACTFEAGDGVSGSKPQSGKQPTDSIFSSKNEPEVSGERG